jgi:hypothetical protein
VKVLLLCGLAALCLAGCALPGHLYPIEGPLAAQNPAPIASISADQGAQILGTVLPGNLQCGGSFHSVAGDDVTARNMNAEWDRVYGPGFFVANVLGNALFKRAALKCADGSVLNLELVGLYGIPAKGVARDAAGNLFKVTF